MFIEKMLVLSFILFFCVCRIIVIDRRFAQSKISYMVRNFIILNCFLCSN